MSGENPGELDTQVLVEIDGPFGRLTCGSAMMRRSEAAMTSTNFEVGGVTICKILSVKLIAAHKNEGRKRNVR